MSTTTEKLQKKTIQGDVYIVLTNEDAPDFDPINTRMYLEAAADFVYKAKGDIMIEYITGTGFQYYLPAGTENKIASDGFKYKAELRVTTVKLDMEIVCEGEDLEESAQAVKKEEDEA